MAKAFGHGIILLALTALTQIGGLAWLAALPFRRRWLAFPLVYAGLSAATLWLAPFAGRVPLPCLGDGPLRSHSFLFCAMNRHYVTPEMRALALDLAEAMATARPGTVTTTLDAGFPFLAGFPLLPHLSHDDGEKLDIALYWQDAEGRYQPARSKSPIGYWGYAEGAAACPPRWLDLRWDMEALNSALPDWRLEPERTEATLSWLARDQRVAKILVEPHVSELLNPDDPKIRFQGCRAARHDDHIHLQL